MIIIWAVVCSLATGNCTKHTITDSDVQEGLSMSSCYDVAKIAGWMQQNYPAGYRMAKFGCTVGTRSIG